MLLHAAQNPGGSDVTHPVLWSGTAASWEDFSSANAISGVSAISGDQQVGDSVVAPLFLHEHAALWTGTPGSFVDLHPASTADSLCIDTDGAQQVGYAYINGNTRASVWSGSAGSSSAGSWGPGRSAPFTAPTTRISTARWR